MPEPLRCPACDHLLEPTGAASDAQADRRAQPTGPEPLATESITEIASGGDDYHSTRSRRGRTSPLARSIRWLSLALVLAGIAAVIYQSGAIGPRQPPRRTVEVDPRADAPPTIGSPDVPAVPPNLPTEQPASPLVSGDAPRPSDLLPLIHRGVVLLETEDADGTVSLGTGFLAARGGESSRPVIVTNYHVLSSATSAYARFYDGSRHAVSGYWAIARETDLAAVELASLPVDAQPLAVGGEDLKLREPVVSVGHPQGIEFSTYPGEVSTIVPTTELPSTARRYLRQSIAGERNLLWIQHTARLSSGNSGGPLLNGRGQVVGVNTWTNHQVGFSYALHPRHIRSLLAEPLTEVAPLQEYTTRKALAAETRGRMSAETLNALLTQVESFGFVPRSTAHYRQLQELAVALTYAGKQGELAENSARWQQHEALVRAADQVGSRLRSHRWNDLGTITIVNDFAFAEYRRPLAGVFLFAAVERVVTGDDGTRGMLMKLVGGDEQIFLPLDGLLIEPEPGTGCLIVGMNFQGQVVRYGDNPLALTEVPVIVAAGDGIIELKP